MPRSDTNSPDWATFEGYSSPNYTMVPDQLFDEHLAYLSGAELKVLLYVIRRTFGFKKGTDRISKSQLETGIRRLDGTVLDHGTGLSRRAIRLALDNLVGRNLLVKLTHTSPTRGYETSEYALNIRAEAPRASKPASEQGSKAGLVPPGVQSTQAPLGRAVPKPLGRGVPIQETVLQETHSSNIRRAAQAVDNSGPDRDGQGRPIKQQRDTKVENAQPAPSTLTRSESSATEQGKSKVLTALSRGEGNAASIESSNGLPAGKAGRSHGQSNGPELLGAILNRHTLRPEEHDARQAIESYVKDIAQAFGDKAKLKSSVTRAYNLYEQSGRTLHGFVDALFLARANVKERQESTTQEPIQNRMSYFFSVLADQLGVTATAVAPSAPTPAAAEQSG